MTTDPATSSPSGIALNNTLSPGADAGNDPGSLSAAADKPRLTEQEKKNNHIASEQKRRQAIREGFDEIADIVPGLKGQGRSEAIVLQGATRHVKRLLAERWLLLEEGKRKIQTGSGPWAPDLSKWEMDPDTMEMARRAVEERDNGGGMSDLEQTDENSGGG